MSPHTDWVSALAILSAGLILGLLFVYFFGRRKPGQSAPENLELRDLEAKRDVLIGQIRELDDVSSKFTAEQAAAERTRLEIETAHVLREIDAIRRTTPKRGAGATATAAAAQPEATPVVVSNRRAAMIGFAWGVGSVAALGLLGYFVFRSATPREDGGQPQAMQQQPAQTDAMLQQIETAVKNDPNNIDLRVDLAQAYLERENLMGVFEQTQFVLAKAPDNSRALTYEALVRMAMGESAKAVEMLEKAKDKDPNLLDAWVALAWVHTQEGDKKKAESVMQEAIKRRPDEKVRLQQVLAQMLEHENAPAAAQPVQAAGGELPPGHPPITGGPTPAPPLAPQQQPSLASAPAPPTDGKAVRITIDLDASARARTNGNGIIYVIARPAGVMAGPPVAVKRLASRTLPMTFDLSSADSMMGQPLPPSMRLEVRLDSDGDAATKNPNDPYVAQDKVAMGSAIRLAMK